jgi:predicted AAA+ superfamily ATPase
MAWQLNGAAAFAAIAESDENGTAPDASLIEKMLEPHQPVVLLMDELVAYLRQFEDGRSYAGGTFESNLTFIQNLTQAFKGVPRAIMLVSLPASKLSEAGSARGKRAMDQLEGALSLTSLEKDRWPRSRALEAGWDGRSIRDCSASPLYSNQG